MKNDEGKDYSLSVKLLILSWGELVQPVDPTPTPTLHPKTEKQREELHPYFAQITPAIEKETIFHYMYLASFSA